MMPLALGGEADTAITELVVRDGLAPGLLGINELTYARIQTNPLRAW